MKPKDAAKNQLRSRAGCARCRQKRLSCDKAKPTCLRCVQKGVSCEYIFELKFKEDFLSRGISFGREGVWTKSRNDNTRSYELSSLAKEEYFVCPSNFSGSYHFINTFYEDILFKTPKITSSLPNPYAELVTNESHESSYALAYYLEYVSPIFNPTNFTTNSNIILRRGLDFQSLIEYSNSSLHILHLLLSVGSSYLTRASTTKKYWSGQAKSYKNMALVVFNDKFKQLDSSKITQNELVCDLLLSTLLLCLFDLANDCNDNWSNHLEIAQYLFNQFNERPKTDFQTKAFDFIFDFFCYQEVMGRTACSRKRLFTFCDDDSLISWMGCNKNLINIISDITNLTSERKHISRKHFYLSAEAIAQRLSGIEVFKIDLDSINENNREEVCFLLSCESKRLATQIYFECALLDKSPKDLNIEKIVKKLGDYLKLVIVENGFFWSFSLWTIFIFSVEIDPLGESNEVLRSLTLDMLGYLEMNSLGNVNKVREIIQSIWKKRDLGMGGLDSNDWEAFISNDQLNISLA